ncbi:GGDEF domain-containing protein [Pseudoalteromonas piratica]|uniref:diguanylate cyclase n=1 Tax=Pseudoalteromonas piratica TaxID=1348114 RepID=A0A0A7EKB3_9GAMM|nr:GGDEF domain-containing protein [Pseudoalteromonas piratica]AIY67064.1 diguanylate cyclase [Pseudoalteromonas piratica]
MSQQVSILRTKLDSAIKGRKQVEHAYKVQIDYLTQFIAKLSLVCKGLDLELDNRLAKYRSTIQKGVDYEQLVPLLDEISKLFKEQAARAESNLSALHQSVESAGKKLQRKQGLPDDLRRNLRTLLTSDLESVKTTTEFIPVLTRLVEIYHLVLEKKVAGNSDSTSIESKELAQELQNLISELAFEGDSGQRIDAIKQRISSEFNLSALLECCVEIIRIIVETISQERASAQKFLFAINETLSLLQASLMESVKRSSKINLQMENLNKQIQDKMNNISQEVDEAQNITTLKQLIAEKMESLTCDLAAKEKLEQLEREELVKTLREMGDRVNKLEKETEHYQERLAEQRFKSLQDSLTQLPNRAAFDERFALEYNTFKRDYHDLCIVVADIDHFKHINDNYGHSAGDKTLQVVAKALKKAIRVTDFIARFGGEEFVLIMPHSKLEQISVPLEKLRRSIKAIPFKFKQKSVTITISFGATQIKQSDSMQEAFDRADEALYEAKNTGRDRIVLKK